MTDLFFMQKALELAIMAMDQDEVPVGAILVNNQRIIGRGQNQTEHLNDVTAHAEMIAMSAGCELLGSKYLEECTLFVTLEPCVMCAGALRWAQIGRIIYGASDEKYGFMKFGKEILHPKTKLEYGLLESECSTLLKEFFKKKRNKG
ncbi:MAG: nucleoside deaminase [Saprospiraceae bacterium]